MAQTRICLVGTGAIADHHAEVLAGLDGRTLSAVVDKDEAKANAFARRWGDPAVYTSVAEALDAQAFDRAHVLVPPEAHEGVASELVEAGIATLVEKPLADSGGAARRLVARAAEGGVELGVNQNFIQHPAYARLAEQVRHGAIGQLLSVDCTYMLPLRQMSAGQFGHWMFAQPQNLLLEQAVHPLSQIVALAGEVRSLTARPGKAEEIAPGKRIYPSCDVLMECERAPAVLRFRLGAGYPHWVVTVVGTDGAVSADIVRNRTTIGGRTRWLEPIDHAVTGLAAGSQTTLQAMGNLARYGLATLGLRTRSDGFFLSMKTSIVSFHEACDRGRPDGANAAFGAALVDICESISAEAFRPNSPPKPHVAASNAYDIAVLGGTGFIGRHVVERLLNEDRSTRIGVAARSARNLPGVFHQDRVQLIQADLTSEEAVATAIDSAPVVVNLAHGGGGDSWHEIERRMVGSARTIAEVCLRRQVERLVHVGSIAGLYLGDPDALITGDTPPDPASGQRAHYARGKAEADRLLMALNGDEGLPVVILRPGLVIGRGTPPFHSGVGFFNSEQHCLGWNRGRNPLPFVLAEDVAAAIAAAASAQGVDGRAFNLVGDVRPTARDYIAALAEVTGRPLRFHGHAPAELYGIELAKWGVKRIGGRHSLAPSYRDLLSRGLCARFDCRDVQTAIGWRPVADYDSFIDAGLRAGVASGG